MRLQPQAKFKNPPHADGGVAAQAKTLMRVTLQGKRSHAMPGFNQTGRLQLGNGLANHGATDAVLPNDRGFGRQFFTRCDLPKQDALSQLGDNVVRQARRTLAA